MHKKLAAQIRKHFGTVDNVPEELRPFLESVDKLLDQQAKDGLPSRRRKSGENGAPSQRSTGQLRLGAEPRSMEYRAERKYEGSPLQFSETHTPTPEQTGARPDLAIPIQLRDQTLGALDLSFDNPEAARENAPILEQIVNRLALAVENARLFEATQTSLQRTDALLQVSRSVIALEDLTNLLQSVADTIAASLPADQISISTFDQTVETISLHYTTGLGAEETGTPPAYQVLLDGPVGEAIRARRPILLNKQAASTGPRKGKTRSTATPDGALMAVPLLSRGEVLGVLSARNRPEGAEFGEQDLDLMSAMANQIATAVENTRLFSRQQQRARELQTAADVSRTASSTLDLNELLNRTVELIREQFDLYYAGVFLLNESGSWADLRAGSGEAGRRQLARGHRLAIGGDSMIGRTIAGGKPSIALDVGEVESRFKNPDLPDTQSEMALPLISRGQTIGAMTIQSVRRAAFTDENVTTLQTMADQLANAIQNASLFAQAQSQNQELAVLNEMGRALTSSLELEQIADILLTYTSRLMEFTSIILVLYDQENQRLTFPLAFELGERLQISPFPRGQGLVDYVINTRKALLIESDVTERCIELGIQFRTTGQSAQSWLGVPILLGEQVYGVISVQDVEKPNRYTQRSESVLVSISNLVANALQNTELFSQVEVSLRASEEQARRLAVLNTLSASLSTVSELDHVFELVAEKAIEIFQADRSAVALVLPDGQAELRAVAGRHLDLPAGERFDLRDTPEARAISRRELVVTSDVDIEGDPVLRSSLTAPFSAANAVIATVRISSFLPNAYQPRDQNLLIQIVSLVNATLANRQLFDQVQDALSAAESLYDASSALNRAQSYEDILATLQRHTLIGRDALYTALHLFDRPWTADRQPRSFQVIARHTKLSPERLKLRYPLTIFPEPTKLLKADQAVFFEGFEDSLAADDPVRMHFTKVLGAASGLIAPLNVRERWIGFVMSYSNEPQRMPDSQIQRMMAIIGQAAVAVQGIQNLELAQQRAVEAQKRSQELAIVNRVVASVSRERTLQAGLQIVADELALAVGADRVGIALMNAEQSSLTVVAEHHTSPTEPPTVGLRIPVAGNPSMLQVLETQKTLFIEDARNDPRISVLHDEFRRRQIQSVAILPLVARNQVIGTVGLDLYEDSEPFNDEQMRLAETIVLQATSAIQSIRLFEETNKRAAQLQTAAEVARDTTSALNLEVLLRRAADFVRERFGYSHASIFLLDDTRQNAIVQASTGEAGMEMVARRHSLAVGSQSIVGQVTEGGEALVINDVSSDPIHRPNPLLPDTQAELGIPLKIGARVIGALDVQSNLRDAFSADDVTVLQTLADQLAVAVDNARTYELANQAFQESRQRVDELTSLFNVSQELSAAPLETVDIAKIAIEKILGVLGEATNCTLALLEPESGQMRTVAEYRLVDGKLEWHEDPGVWDFVLAEYPASQKVIETLQPLLVQSEDPRADPAELAYMASSGAKTLLILPLAVKGQGFGLIEIETWDKPRLFSTEQINLGMTIANQAAAALENARLYQDQLETTEQLRELDKLKNEFLANMSHELRTPLNSIIGFSRVILKGIDGPVTDLQQQDLTAIYNAGGHLLGLINDILDLSRIEAGKMELNFEELDVEALITSVMATGRGLVKEKPIELVQVIEPDLPVIFADSTRVRQVLLNLINNATKFTDQGTITVTAVRSQTRDGRRAIRVGVEDTGIGISPEHQSILFQPFTMVDTSATRKVGGTGLGLSISKNLVELHQGEIGVISAVGQGSTFYFLLPYEEEIILPKPEVIADTPVSNGTLILAVDDDPRVTELYGRFLTPHGYQVIPLNDPGRTLQMARELQPYAITLDVMMPKMNGWEVLEGLKSDAATRHIPIVFCSIIDDESQGLRLGASAYLRKPIQEDELAQVLDSLHTFEVRRNVLVIDDSQEDLRLVEKILLSSELYSVTLAQGGEAGLRILKTQRPDIIILDVKMPGVDGFQVLNVLKDDPALGKIPVILLTEHELNQKQIQELEPFTVGLLRKSILAERDLLNYLRRIPAHN